MKRRADESIANPGWDVSPIDPGRSRWELPDMRVVTAPDPDDHPDPDDADLVAIGADLRPATLLAAYRAGMFPMPLSKHELGWFSPEPRAIIPVDGVRITRSLRQSVRRYDVTVDQSFRDVMVACADPDRPRGWISADIVDAYTRMHELGWAHSVECRADDGTLVGGLYGVRIAGFFAGESMFSLQRDASKVALVALVDLMRESDMELLDVQWLTPHLESLGAVAVSRIEYLGRLDRAVRVGQP